MCMCAHVCIHTHREDKGLVLEDRNKAGTISSWLIFFAFPFFLLLFSYFNSSKKINLLARVSCVVTPCSQCGGLMLWPVWEHSVLRRCCVLAVSPHGAVSCSGFLPTAGLGLQLAACRLQGF